MENMHSDVRVYTVNTLSELTLVFLSHTFWAFSPPPSPLPPNLFRPAREIARDIMIDCASCF